MQIEIHHISSQGTKLNFEKKGQQFAVIKAMIEQGECDFVAPILISLQVVPEKDLFKVSGRINTMLRLECARCLTQFDAPVARRFNLNYSRQIIDDLQPDGPEGVELTAQQIGMCHFQGETIDFTDAVQEQLVLSVPYRAVCNEACKGLCAHCGIDLNQHACKCADRIDDTPFAVLKKLKH